MSRLFSYCLAFLCGAAVMVLEMVGFRLFAPYFGYSTYTTGAMISAMMLAMAVGYLLGGWLADRVSKTEWVYALVLGGSVGILGLVLVARPCLRWLQTWGIVQGTLVAALLLFAFPMALLCTVSPFLIKFQAEEGKVGATAGQISAVSTIGSIVGTLLASFWMIPTMGVQRSLLSVFVVVFVLGVTGLAKGWKRIVVLPVALALSLGIGWGLRHEPLPKWITSGGYTILSDTQSRYSRLIVAKAPGADDILLFPSALMVQSIWSKNQTMTGSDLDFHVIGGMLAPSTKRILMLGVGAGTAFAQLQSFFPKASLTGVDIDRKIMEAGVNYFGLRPRPTDRLLVLDARRFLQRTQTPYEVVAMNLFSSGLFIPFYLATQECFSLVAKQLSPKGWVVMNIIDMGPNKRLSRHILWTAKQVFSHVYEAKIGSNVVMLASRGPLDRKRLLQAVKAPPFVKHKAAFLRHFELIREFRPKKGHGLRALRDDWSPLEKMTFQAYQASQKQFQQQR